MADGVASSNSDVAKHKQAEQGEKWGVPRDLTKPVQ